MRREELSELAATGQSLWPSLDLSCEELSEVLDPHHDKALAELDAGELYLACACALGQGEALAIFEQRYFGCVAPSLASMSLGADEVDEIKQELRVRLFVTDGEAKSARIIKYAGQGNLQALIRVAAVRAGLSRLRKAKRDVHDEDWLQDQPARDDSPELARFKGQHRGEFKRVFEDAARALTARDRSLLRRHYVDKLSIDEIGIIYGVHRATAARWLVKAREELVASSRLLLKERWKLDASEMVDMLPMVESQVDLSLGRLLRSLENQI